MRKRLFILSLFIAFVVVVWSQKTIKSYEYWFDDNYSEKSASNVSPVSSLKLNTSISTSDLYEGLHTFQIQFKEVSGIMSSSTTMFFVKMPKTREGQGAFSQYEYWIDYNYTTKEQQTVSSQSKLSLVSSISASALTVGLHTFQIRFKEGSGIWSSPITQFFVRIPKIVNGQDVISEYEYWFDADYSHKVQKNNN